jgi:gas vesicle protein
MGKRHRNSSAPEGVVFLNYAQSKIALPKAEDIETLVPAEAMEALTNGDDEPYFKIEAIDFPAKGTGGVYEGSFFKSFINVTKNRPIPGSKRGHEWVSRPASDFYTVGGRIETTDNGKTGTAYLKVYIPPIGDPTENAAFRRDAQANMVHFSLVTKPDYTVKIEEDERGSKVQVNHFTASKGYERNDAMEYGAGAMDQIVNSASTQKVMPKSISNARSLISTGKIDNTSRWSFGSSEENALLGESGDDWSNYAKWHLVEDTSASEETKARYKYPYGKNGKVYRSALRAIASRAAQSGLSDLSDTASDLIKAIDDKLKSSKRNGRNNMDEELEVLKNALADHAVSVKDISEKLGFSDRLRNEKDEANAETIKTLNAKLGEKPLERLDAILTENAANAAFAVEKAVAEIAGPAKMKNAKGEDVPNPAHSYAAKACAGLTGEALKNGVETLKTDPVMITLNAARADGNSPLNRVEHGGRAETTENSAYDGIPTYSMKRKEA